MPAGSTLSSKEVDDLVSYLLQAGDENSKRSSAHSTKSDDTTTIKSLPRTIAIVSLAFAAILSLRADTRTFSLEAVEPGFWNLFDRNAQLTKVATASALPKGQSGTHPAICG